MVLQAGITGRSKRAQQLISKLRRTNSEISRILERLPLSDHGQVARLARLFDEQKRLVLISAKTQHESVNVLLDNAKHSARYLQSRYADAMKKGRLRKTK